MAEFWAGRESVIEEAGDITDTVGALNKLGDQYMSRVREWANRAGLREQATDNLVRISRSAFDETIKGMRSLADDKALKITKNTAKDLVASRLNHILEGRVGSPLSAERKRAAINQEAPQRFADRQPPGYMDANKKNGNNVGDYLLWIETLAEASQLKVDVLFVTGDTKEDWWRHERGQAKGAHPQLVEEMRNVAGVRLFMLRPESFPKHSGDLLQVKVSPEAVQDAQRVTARIDISWRAASIDSEVVEKLRSVFGDSVVSSADLNVVSGMAHQGFDAVVRRPGKVPVVLAVKYIASIEAMPGLVVSGLEYISFITSKTHDRGVLILILSDDFSDADVEASIDSARGWSSTIPSGLYTIYVKRYSDFLAESAENFATKVMPL
jgi:hypothetical protein